LFCGVSSEARKESHLADFYSSRFGKDVWITRHARLSMLRRGIDFDLLQRIVETGVIRQKDSAHLWVYLQVEERADNLLCVAAVNSTTVIIKTAMIHWSLEETS
jgi:Domain of unknown function (DUF4258)